MSNSAPTAASAGTSVRLECVIPILRVTDLVASLRWYNTVLGFTTDWQSGAMASVSRDRMALMLCDGAQGHVGGWVWVGVTDVVPLHAELCARGAEVIMPPTNFFWAYEIRVRDPDGNVLRFGSEPRGDLPLADPARA